MTNFTTIKSVFIFILCSFFTFNAFAAFPTDFWPQFGQNAEWTVTSANELSFVGNPGNSAMVATSFGNLGVPPFAGVRLTYDAYISANGGKNFIVILGSNAGFPGTGIMIVGSVYQIQALKNFDYGTAINLSSNVGYYQSSVVIPGAYNAFIIDVSVTGLITVTINGYQCPATYQADMTVLNATGSFAAFCPGFSPFLLKNLTVTKGVTTKRYFHPIIPFTGSYYIDAVNGEDSASGHADTDAWKTFANINNRILTAGTNVLLKCGSVWNNRLEIRGAGTVNNWITVGSYGTGNKPKISLTNNPNDIGLLICDLDKTSGIAKQQNISYIEVKDIEISNTRLGIYYRSITGTTNTGFRVSNVTFNNINCDPVMTAINSASNKDTEISNQLAAVKGNLQTIGGATDGGVREYLFPAAIFIGGQTQGNQTVSGTHTTVLTELEVYNCQFNEAIAGVMSVFYWPFVSGGGTNIWRQLVNKVKLNNCTATGVVNGAIAFDGVNGGAVADVNGVMQPDANGWGLFKNVRVTMGASAPGRTYPHGTTGVILSNCQKMLVDSCEFSEVLNQGNPDGCGFDFETNNDLVTIQNTKFINNDGHSVLIMNGGGFGGNTNLVFQNNLFAGNIKSGTSTTEFSLSNNSDGHSNVKFRNNIVFMRKKNINNQNITLYDPARTYFTQTQNDLYYLEPTASSISVSFLDQIYTYNAQVSSVNSYYTLRDSGRQPTESPTYFLGDAVSFAWDINSFGWSAGIKKAGMGTSNTSAGMNWQNIIHVDDGGDGVGNNEGIRSATYTTNSVGTWYYSLWLGTGATVGSAGSWNKSNAVGTIGSATFTSSLFTVQALGNPTNLSATRTNGTTANLSWTNAVDGAQNHEILIVRKRITGTFTEPTQGVYYDPTSNTLGVVFAGTATNWTDNTLDPNFAYQYKVYTRNNNYYSSGELILTKYIIASGLTNVSSVSVCSTCDLVVENDGVLVIDQTRTYNNITISPRASLVLTSGNTLTAANVTLQSDATGTATLVDNTTNSPQAVTATVQQYVTSGRNWYMSIPLASGASSLLSRGTSVVCYNEPTSAWIAPAGNTLDKLRGYVQVATSTPSITGTTGTVDFTGVVNTGVHSINLTRTAGKTGFNLVGNPYPSYLDWNLVTRTNVLPTMWYRTKEGGVYKFYTFVANGSAGVGSPATVTNKIPPMQAFWVRVNTVGTGSIAVDNTMRAHKDVTGNIMKAPIQTPQKLLRLQVSNGTNTDETVLYFNANASDAVDQYDAPKRSNEELTIPEIYTQVGTEQLVINGMNSVKYNTEIPIGFSTAQANDFSISANELSNFEAGTKVILIDKQNPTVETELSNGVAYNFSAPITAATTNRFSLIFRAPNTSTEINNTFKLNAQVFVNTANQITLIAPEKCNYSIYNIMGEIVKEGLTVSNRTTLNTFLESGMYIINVSDNEHNFISKKLVISN